MTSETGLSTETASEQHSQDPWRDRRPASTPHALQACIENNVPVYVDLSDPLEFIEAAQDMSSAAAAAGTAAVVSAGAFPGLSNVLSVELARQLPAPPADVKFSYFTAGALCSVTCSGGSTSTHDMAAKPLPHPLPPPLPRAPLRCPGPPSRDAHLKTFVCCNCCVAGVHGGLE